MSECVIIIVDIISYVENQHALFAALQIQFVFTVGEKFTVEQLEMSTYIS